MATSRDAKPRNGKLSIPLPFDEAVKAALKAKPPEKRKSKSARDKARKKPRAK